MQKIKLGMIGGGFGAFIGDAHRRASRICDDYLLTGGVFDADYERGMEFAKQQGLDPKRCYATPDAFIEGESALSAEERIRAVSIVTPNSLHYEFAKKLLEAGFHVVCEKPMTMTLDEALDLKNSVESTELSFALTHTYTGYPMVRQMKEIVKSGALGQIHRVDAQYYQGWVNSILQGTDSGIKGIWRLDPKFAGVSSCMGDIGVHAFNLIEYTVGLQIKQVLADLSSVKEHVQLDLDGTVLLRMPNNIKGLIRSSQVAAGEENNLSIAIYGSKAGLKWSQEDPNFLYMLSDSEPTKVYKPGHNYNTKFAEAASVMPPGHPEGIYEALGNIYKGFAKSIRGKEFFEGEFPTVEDGVRGMKFIHSVVESNKKNNIWVDL